MDEIASKTFASQFLGNNSMMATPFEKLVVAVKHNRFDVLSTSREALKQKDANEKNLLFYAVYEKSPQCLLLLLRAGLNHQDIDSQHKNLLHFCAYSGSYQCLSTLIEFIKVCMIMEVNKNLLSLLTKYNYKRTDAKNGKLKYSVSPKRMQAFTELQEILTKLYADYFRDYQEKIIFKMFEQVDEVHQRNPFHLVCLNKYQKCLVTLEEMIYHFNQPSLILSEKTIENYMAIDPLLGEKMDPRLYSDTLDILSNFIHPQALSQIHGQYETVGKKKLQALLLSKDRDEHSPLYLASRNGSTGMINMLKKYEPKQKQEQKEQIMKVASNNMARSHIIDLCDAAKLSDVKPLNFLISCGDGINEKKTIFGTFPLLEAIRAFSLQQNIESIKTLMKNDADLNQQDSNGWTALHHAAHLGLKDVVELIISSPKDKINLNKMTNKRYHALHLAAISDHSEVIQALMQSENCKFDINVKDWDGLTPLLHAAKKGSISAMKTLLHLNCDLYASDKLQMTALHHAAFSNHHACVKELLFRDSDEDKLISMRTSKGKLAKDLATNVHIFENIFTAARTNNINVIRKQISLKDSVKDSVTPKKERTPLIIAVLCQAVGSVRFLLQNGADTYHQDKEQKSAMQYCEDKLAEAKQEKKKEQIKTWQTIKSLLE